MELNKEIFVAKCLLFGEYTILLNGTGFSVPLNNYYGSWKFDKDSNPSNKILKGMLDYLGNKINIGFDIALFKKDLENGLYFDSNIPQGYGVGSSAALTTALYKRYVNQEKALNVRSDLSSIESFFHGQSSGLDPLVPYYGQNVYLNQNELRLLEGDYLNNHFFLLDTHQERSTKPLVDYFKDRYSNNHFFKNKMNELSLLNEQCIHKYLNKDLSIVNELKMISEIQFEYMNRMIPEHTKPLWKESLANPDVIYKLNGAGGGGFLMVFAVDDEYQVNGEELISLN